MARGLPHPTPGYSQASRPALALFCPLPSTPGRVRRRGGGVPDVYKIMLDAELNRAFDVWSGYLNAETGENPRIRARLRATLQSAREAAAEGDPASARAWVAEMYDAARQGGLAWAPVSPDPCAADWLTRATTPRTNCGTCFQSTCARISTASRSTCASRAAASRPPPISTPRPCRTSATSRPAPGWPLISPIRRQHEGNWNASRHLRDAAASSPESRATRAP